MSDIGIYHQQSLALPAMLVPQVLVSEKSPGFGPVILIPVKFNCVLPVFVTVTF